MQRSEQLSEKWSEQLSGGLLQAAPDAIVVSDRHGRVVLVNDQAERLFGYRQGDLLGRAVDVLVPAATPAVRAQHRGRFQSGTSPRPLGVVQMVGRRNDGTEFPAEISLAGTETGEGEFVVAVIRDVTERDATAQTLALVASIVQSSHDAIVSSSLDGHILTFNPAAERLYGWSADEMIGKPAELLVPELRRRDEREITALVAGGARLERFPTERQRSDGRLVKVSLAISPLTAPDATIIGVVATARDFSERERAEARVQTVLEAAPDAMIGVDAAGRIVLVNRQAEKIFDYPRHDLLGHPVSMLLPAGLPAPGRVDRTAPADAAAALDAAGAMGHADAGDGVDGAELQPATARRRDGATFPVEITVRALDTVEEDGPVTCAAVRDISRRLQAAADAEQLRAEAAEQRMMVRMHRAERLESLGQLAGGIAHDFNNLLGVILNYADFAAEDARAHGDELDGLVTDIEQIARAARRGADLTHQLLAFARREITRPKVLDLNHTIAEVEQLLRRAIGEHITLTTRAADALPAVTIDPGQLEQVLVNLAVNARDAMPTGGHLTIDTTAVTVDAEDAADANLSPGTYVRLRVSDTGTGMPKHVIERAFEPFFTTKATGQGTGLGLATVHGIINQAGGTIRIYSESGIGTTINILLPATDATPDTADAPAETRQYGHGETILVVEDEPALREITGRVLATGGYHVLPAEDGVAARTIAANFPDPIDLLLTDVVMPNMLGKELAEHLVAERPTIKVVYMSGYAQPVLASHGTLDPDVILIEKPFTGAELLATIRRQLDQPRGNDPSAAAP